MRGCEVVVAPLAPGTVEGMSTGLNDGGHSDGGGTGHGSGNGRPVAATAHSVQVGQVYEGFAGKRMVVLAVDGDECQLEYQPNPTGEEPCWGSAHEVQRYLTLVPSGS